MQPFLVPVLEILKWSNNADEAKKWLKEADIFKDDSLLDHRITIMSKRCMTAQTPIEKFREELKNRDRDGEDAKVADGGTPSPYLSRLMECISIKTTDDDIHLLCDDERSLMRKMYDSTLFILRGYEFPKEA